MLPRGSDEVFGRNVRMVSLLHCYTIAIMEVGTPPRHVGGAVPPLNCRPLYHSSQGVSILIQHQELLAGLTGYKFH